MYYPDVPALEPEELELLRERIFAPVCRLQEQIANENLDETTETPDDAGRADSITVGDNVFHKIFGQGEVLEISDTGSCKVRFADGKVRFLRSTFLSRLA